MKVELLISQWRDPQTGRRYQAGGILDLPEDQAQRLLKLNAAAIPGKQPEEPELPEEPQANDPETQDEPEEPQPKKKDPKRPRRSSSVADWRSYAKSLGIKDISGLSKAQIIAAVEAL